MTSACIILRKHRIVGYVCRCLCCGCGCVCVCVCVCECVWRLIILFRVFVNCIHSPPPLFSRPNVKVDYRCNFPIALVRKPRQIKNIACPLSRSSARTYCQRVVVFIKYDCCCNGSHAWSFVSSHSLVMSDCVCVWCAMSVEPFSHFLFGMFLFLFVRVCFSCCCCCCCCCCFLCLYCLSSCDWSVVRRPQVLYSSW